MPLQIENDMVLNEKTNRWVKINGTIGNKVMEYYKDDPFKTFELNEPEQNQYVEIKESNIHGVGVFAKCFIKKGTIIQEYYAKRMKWSEFVNTYGKYKENSRYTYPMRRQGLIYVAKEEPYKSKNISTFINERREPNVQLSKLQLIACHDINKDEELFLHYPKDYGRDYDL